MPGAPLRVSPEEQMISSTVVAEPSRSVTYEENPDYKSVHRLRILLDHRYTLLRFMAYGLALITLVAFLLPFQFESRTLLMPPDNDLSSSVASLMAISGRTGGGLGMLAGDLLGLKTSGQMFIGILHSQTVEDRIVNQFDLKKVYGVKHMQQARRRLEANADITEDRKSGIIAITVTDHSPERASAIGQAYVKELDRLVMDLNTSAAHRERVFLEGRLKTVKQDLDASSQAFSQFASNNSTLDLKEQGKAMVEAAATLQGHLIAAQSELEGLRQIYADTNVRVRAVRARIEELQKKLQEMSSGDLDATANTTDNRQLYPSIRKLPLLGVTYTELYRTNKIQETVFELLTQQCELAKVQEAKETPSVKVLDPAKVPERKSFPPRLLMMAVGTFLAMLIGCLWILGQARWDGLDPSHPAKLLAQDAYTKLRADLGMMSRNRSLGQVRSKILWFRRNSDQDRG